MDVESPAPNVDRLVISALAEITDEHWDWRSERRTSYFGPVTLRFSGTHAAVSAFARDVSPIGIGLVHLTPLPTGEAIAVVPLPSGRILELRTQIIWAKDYGNGWYASGGQFLGLVS
jgi:hypothetical protein